MLARAGLNVTNDKNLVAKLNGQSIQSPFNPAIKKHITSPYLHFLHLYKGSDEDDAWLGSTRRHSLGILWESETSAAKQIVNQI